MKISAGIAIIVNNKILLVHPTNASWTGTYSIPKGLVEEGEKIIDAAIRETEEEIGVLVYKTDLEPEPIVIPYKSKAGKTYKRVIVYIARYDEEFEIGKELLQQEEVDWAGFLNKEEAKDKIFWRINELLNLIE